MFTFPIGHMSGAVRPSVEYKSRSSSTASLTTYNFTSVNIGPARSDRLVVVCIGGFRDIGGDINSATIGGVAATVHTSENVINNSHGIISANVPSGTTATVSITWSVAQAGCSIDVYVVTGLSSFTADFTATDTSGGLSQTISPAANSVVIATATKYPSAGWTWGGTAALNEDADGIYSSQIQQSSASKEFTAAAPSVTVTATPSPGSTGGMSIVGFS